MVLLMGIDIGSTSIKANIYDLKGKLVSRGTRPTELSHPYKDHPSWCTWEPDIIWNAIKDSIKKAVRGLDKKDDIASVAVTGFGMDGVPIDKDGKWLYPFISWHCPRTEEISGRWSSKVGPDVIFSKTGKQVMPIDTVYRILWVKENHPEILDQTYKWLLIEDYVNYLLCGEIATDYSMASCTSLFDQKSRKWSGELLKRADIDISLLPEPQPSGTLLGNISSETSAETGLSTSTKVVLGGHDYHCAALAVGAFIPETVMSVNGTWEMILQSSKTPMLEKEVFENGINVESHIAKDMYNIVAYSVSGLMYEWVDKTLCFEENKEAEKSKISHWDILEKKAAAIPVGSNGLFFAPYFSGAGSPYVDRKASGAFIGLTNDTDKGSIIRSVIEALNYQSRDMIDAFENAAGSAAEKIVATGGPSKSALWNQNKADITGKLIEIPDVDEATPLGAAIVSGIGIGVYKNEKEAFDQTYRIDHTCEPDPKNKKLYDDYFIVYKKLYPDLKNINDNIFDRFRQ